MSQGPRIAVIGLGYVGLPLAVALSRHFQTAGLDVNRTRLAELKEGHDRTGEISADRLQDAPLELAGDPADLPETDIFIVTVPTPVGADNEPDLGAVEKASLAVGAVLKPGNVVVYESTVYPGVTEDFCGPLLERASGLRAGEDFFLGYSPERINPGDVVHTVDKITKVVSGQTPEVAALLARVYGSINGGNVFIARDIRTAEASKVIENAQRDINIAFVNEISLIFGRMGLSVYDVLEAAGTKWNFLPFRPGLVGGHCIGVDPYYLAHAARRIGVEPEVILAGRRINDRMAHLVADSISARLAPASRILVLGIAFKENVPDIRNSKVADLVARLRAAGHQVDVFDPLADAAETAHEYGIELLSRPGTGYDCLVGAVPHDAFAGLEPARLLRPGGLVADIKNMWKAADLPDGLKYWSL